VISADHGGDPGEGTVPSNAEPRADAPSDDVAAIIDRHVRPLIDWYQQKKRWPRRLHRTTTVAVILLGASIPLLSVAEPSYRSRLLTATVGVTISGLTGLATVTDWQRRWQVFTGAQTHLEVRLADWELALAEAELSEPGRARELRIEATRNLLNAATAIRLAETDEFFASQPSSNDGLPRWSGALQA